MTIPTLTPLPPAPSRLETEETFVPKADALLAALPTMVTEENAAFTWMDAQLTATESARDITIAAKDAALVAQTASEDAQTGAELAESNTEQLLLSRGDLRNTQEYQVGFNYLVSDIFFYTDTGITTWYLVNTAFTSTDIVTDLGSGNVQVWQGLTKSNGVTKITSVFDPEFAKLVEGQAVELIGYHPDTTVGGSSGVVKLARHNGGTAISLTRARPTDWTDQAQLTSWFADSTVDELCFVRNESGLTNVLNFGVKVGVDSTQAFQKARSIKPLSCYIPSGEYLSDDTGEWLYYGEGVVRNVTGGLINKTYIKARSGDSDSEMVPVSIILRQTTAGSGWFAIDDDGHRTNGFDADSISVRSGDPTILDVPFSFTVDEIGSLNVTPDEVFAKAGIWVGPSVNSVQTSLLAYRDAEFTVSAGGIVTAQEFFSNQITATVNANKTITVTHPPVFSTLDRPMVCARAGASGAGQVPVVGVSSETSFTYHLTAPISGYVYHDGSDWKVLTDAVDKPVITASSTQLTLTHVNRLVGGFLTVTGRGDVASIAFVGGNNEKTTGVIFKDFTGAVINPLTNPTLCKFYYNGPDMVKTEPRTDAVCMRKGVTLRWNDFYGAGGNLWVGGTMEPKRNLP